MIYTPWLWKMGKAEITVDNSIGQAPPVYYALPYNGWQNGAIGLVPQKNPGLVALLAIMGLAVLVCVVCTIGTAALDGN